ncbi:hypothetical protein AAG747_26850 [Rapidithrix thailandica]|uniref:DUF3592 domain-containing protein n=1 Tax=Rapidithrix thailandica TaxID=413964 RepID=A0AAW9S2Z7_9BACT
MKAIFNKMTSLNVSTLIGIFGVTVLILNLVYKVTNSSSLKESGVQTTCVVTKSGYTIIYEYEVRGEKFKERRKHPFDGIEVGDKFMLLYDPSKPENHMPMFSHPVIDEEGDFKDTYTTSVRFDWMNDNIHFSYKVNGIYYERIQRLPPGVEVENIRYKVSYRKDKPRIAYIRFSQEGRAIE